jgi:PAS domain S-box-containing protein
MIQFNEDLRFITTVATGMDGVVVIDENQIILLFNEYAEKMFGYSEKDVLGKTLDFLLPPNRAQQHRLHVADFMKSGVIGRPMAERQIIHGRHADGHEFLIEASISQTTYNRRRYCTAVLRDLTPLRKQQESLQKEHSELQRHLLKHKQELQSTSSRLSEVQRLSQIGLWELDLKNNVLYWSTEVFQIFELDQERFSASYDAFLNAIHPEDRDMVNRVYTESVSNKKPYHIRHRLLMKNGRVKYVEERCETFYNEYDEPIRSVGTIQDITSQIVAEQQRRHLQNLLLRVETLANIGSWEWILDNNQFYWSPELYRLYGINPDETYKPEFILAVNALHPDDREKIKLHLQQAKQGNKFDPVEYRIIRPDGEIRHVRAHGEVLKNNRFESDRIYGFVQDITVYVAAEKEIRDTNQLLEAIFNNTHVSIAYLDRDMNFIRVNRAYAELDNKTPEYFTGRNHFELYPNRDNERIFRAAAESGEPVIVNAKPFEYVDNPQRGITHWDWTLTPIKDESGSVKALVLSLLEVTERIHAIEALQKNEEKLRALNENLEKIVADRTLQLRDERNFIDTVLEIQGALVIVIDRDGNIVRFNRACEKATGYRFEEVRGRPIWDYLIPPDEQPAVRKVFENITSTALPSSFENHWLTKDGDQRLIEWSNSTITDRDGIVRYVIATGIDITGRRKTEKQLLKSEAGLQTAQRIAKVGSWEIDIKTGKIWWSDENYRIFNRDRNKFAPTIESCNELVHPDDVKLVKDAGNQLRTAGHVDLIHRIVLPNGEERTVHEVAETEYDEHQQPQVWRGTVHDITELKRSEEERNQLQRQLQQAQKMESIGQLTGGIAHDFNNILAAILGFTQLAISRFAPDRNGTLGSYLAEIEKGGKRASELVKQMLAFSRGDTQGHTVLDPRPVISETVKMLRSTIPVSIDIDFKPTEEVHIHTDALQLQQAVVNLIINARDALEGKGRIRLDTMRVAISPVECVSCHKVFAGQYVAITVEDNGSGIDKQALPRIFEPFFTTKNVGQGSGMGLALVHGFVHASGGHINVQPNDVKGTRITLYFPVCEPEVEYPDIDFHAGKGNLPARNITKKTILVVDDEESIVKLISEILEIHEYKAVSTTSSQEALKLLSTPSNHFDLLITDQAMPELSGIELIQEIRKKGRDLPVILCTGYSDVVNEFNYQEIGASRYLAKPIWHDELLKAVDELVQAEQK